MREKGGRGTESSRNFYKASSGRAVGSPEVPWIGETSGGQRGMYADYIGTTRRRGPKSTPLYRHRSCLLQRKPPKDQFEIVTRKQLEPDMILTFTTQFRGPRHSCMISIWPSKDLLGILI